MRFNGKLALVTGASRGIGQATAIKLATEGANVAVHYVNSADRAEDVYQQVCALGRQAMVVQADIADREAVNRMVRTITEDLGAIDLLVNNAGAVVDSNFDELTPEQWDRTVAINLTGPFNVIWAVKAGMFAQKFGRIVNVSSIAALAVRPESACLFRCEGGCNRLNEIVLRTFCATQHTDKFSSTWFDCNGHGQ